MMEDTISIAQKLIAFDTRNPPGNERAIAEFIGSLLTNHGFDVNYHQFTETRWGVIADYNSSSSKPALVLSGHLDTVPLGKTKWQVDPFSGVIKDGKLFGRGSSDMKGALAAMIVAAIQVAETTQLANGLKLIFTASEEKGCEGALNLIKSHQNLGEASAIIIGEPTANLPAIGHKGALFIYARTTGVTAHSSMPEKGENAIYKAARAISKLEDFRSDIAIDPLLGLPSINVGMISGGLNPNSVPDFAEFTIDVRSTTSMRHDEIVEKLQQYLGNEVALEPFIDLEAVVTKETDHFVRLVYQSIGRPEGQTDAPIILPYATDASILQKYYRGVPIVILGPGQPELAHQTDEFCYVEAIQRAVALYYDIILQWDRI
jgi:succinyl-diaminopimelate desuccinylase